MNCEKFYVFVICSRFNEPIDLERLQSVPEKKLWLLIMLRVSSSPEFPTTGASSPVSIYSGSSYSGRHAFPKCAFELADAQRTIIRAGACSPVRAVNVLVAEDLGEAADERLNAIDNGIARLTRISEANDPQELTNLVLTALQTERYDLLVVRGNCKITKNFIESIPKDQRPQFILRAGTGLDNLDTEYLKQAGIAYNNTPDVNTNATAELAIALMLEVAKKISIANQNVKNGNWDRKALTGIELSGKTLGVVGVGKIGTTVAILAKGFHMQVLGLIPRRGVPSPKPDCFVGYADLNELCAKADVLTLHVPLEDSTKHLIGKRQLELLAGPNGSKKAILVNVARGGIVDEAALLEILDEGKLYGAGIDVFEQDPAPEGSVSDQLAKHPLVVATSHVGGQTVEASRKMGDAVVQQVLEMHQQLNPTQEIFPPPELISATGI